MLFSLTDGLGTLYYGLFVIRHADPQFPDTNMTCVSRFDGWKHFIRFKRVF